MSISGPDDWHWVERDENALAGNMEASLFLQTVCFGVIVLPARASWFLILSKAHYLKALQHERIFVIVVLVRGLLQAPGPGF